MNEAEEHSSFEMTRRERNIALALIVAALLLMGGLVVLFWKPAPPRVVVMSTGPEDGAYHAFGQRYQQILARSGIRLVLKPSSGALENLARLRSGQDGVTIALVQGGLAQPDATPDLLSLGGVFFEPVWVFQRTAVALKELADLGGQRVAMGVAGSGTQFVARALLAQALAPGSAPVAVDLGGLAAAQALRAGQVDAAIFISAPDAEAVQLLLGDPAISLLGFGRAEAFARRFPFLTRLDLPEGAVDLARNLPPADTALVAATASLVARDSLHPVIVDLMLAAAREVHGRGSVISRAGTFPSAAAPEYPLSPDAERFYKSGPSVLQRYLPFWAVVWIQRLIFLGLPILAIGIPLLRYMPALYRWGMRRRIYRWYGELAFIERSARRGANETASHLHRLDAIERRVSGMRLPPAFAGEAYMLKMHVQMVRGLLQGGAGAAPLEPEQSH
jgi:NMT1-like family